MTSAEIVEKIKRVLLDPEGATQGNLAKLGSEYALRCRRLNANVERAVSMVRLGSLSESERILQECSVFEEFRLLNFDGKDDWRAVCRTLGFEVAILPHEQTLEELRSFADVYERTRDLFSEERRLALQGGANVRRLQILYALESVFPKCEVWKAPVKELERERVAEIASRVKETTKQNVDASFVANALLELEDPNRRSRAPEELLNNLRAWKEYDEKTAALKRLRVLLEEWKKARESNDDFQELACLQYYREAGLSKAAKLATQEEIELLGALAQRAEIIERREKARLQLKRKSRELSRALETDSNSDRLADLFASTELESDKAGEALDPSITRAYRRRMETIETQRRRKRLALVLLLSLTALLFGAATALVVGRAQTKRNVDEAIGAISSKLQDYEGTNGRVEALEEAEEIVKKLEEGKSEFLRFPDYAQVVDRVKNARTQENRRLSEFEDVASKILNAHNQNQPSPRLTSNLKDRCRTEKELAVYSKLKKRDIELVARSDEVKNEVYSQRLNNLFESIKVLEESQNLTENEKTLELSRIKREINEIRQSGSSAVTQLKKLESQVEQIENHFKQESVEESQEEEEKEEETQDSDSRSESEPIPEQNAVPNPTSPNEEIESDAFDEALKTIVP